MHLWLLDWMTVDFYIRAGRNDHTIVDRFLTPSSATLFETNRQPIGTVVADAPVASARPQLARLTKDAGVPYVIDPLTPLLQSEQAESDPWAKLPFAHPEPLAVADLGDYLMDELIDLTFTFQRVRSDRTHPSVLLLKQATRSVVGSQPRDSAPKR